MSHSVIKKSNFITSYTVVIYHCHEKKTPIQASPLQPHLIKQFTGSLQFKNTISCCDQPQISLQMSCRNPPKFQNNQFRKTQKIQTIMLIYNKIQIFNQF